MLVNVAVHTGVYKTKQASLALCEFGGFYLSSLHPTSPAQWLLESYGT